MKQNTCKRQEVRNYMWYYFLLLTLLTSFWVYKQIIIICIVNLNQTPKRRAFWNELCHVLITSSEKQLFNPQVQDKKNNEFFRYQTYFFIFVWRKYKKMRFLLLFFIYWIETIYPPFWLIMLSKITKKISLLSY